MLEETLNLLPEELNLLSSCKNYVDCHGHMFG
ncbi:hypothetical protein TorRG33x02_300040 [Trema orientale]|uniref:Uncharacterized protein n=1 Tax=Trema orientale TaxID=63057 RepID=A0A2P5C2F1_TREOI|nr:hypothetical protein TorRG33x02_300040 [Trema orientale]